MPVLFRCLPAIAGLVIGLLGLVGSMDNPCGDARYPVWIARSCLALRPYFLIMTAVAGGLIALTLILLVRWRNAQRAGSYDSDAGWWIMLGWALAVVGTLSLLAGLLLIGSNGWPFSHQSRHVTIRTGQLPISISTVQPRYFANYSGPEGVRSICASFGEITVENRSRTSGMTLDLDLIVTSQSGKRQPPHAAMPTHSDLNAIVRRGLSAHSIFRNPIELKPRESVRRELVFVFREERDDPADRDYVFAIAVKDRQSRQAISFQLPAEYRG